MTASILCPDEDRLLGMLDCELDQPQQEQVTEHVNECVTCQSRLETLVTRGLRADLEFDLVATHLRDGLSDIDSMISSDDVGQMTETLLSGDAHTAPIISLDFLQPSDAPDSLGRLGQYEVTEVIGRGGMGIALKARDTRLDRIVAVKVLAPELASNPTARKRFLREAKAAAAVSHDHVVTVHAVEPGDLPYLAMEYIDGYSLRQKIDREGPLPVQEILRISMQTARGLAAAHDQGLIHHDIKPANIMLQNGIERVQITDFGLARAVDDVTITRTGEVRGTPQYMSPEQARGESTDSRSDLFSLGDAMYTMCTGRPPFRGDSTMGVLHRVCNDAPREIREINPEIPGWLVSIINRLLEKDREDRFQTAEEVADLLEQCLAHLQQPTVVPLPELAGRPATKTQPTRRKWYTGAIVALTLLIGLGMSEATGVTQLAGTVLRITLGEGTLVIEVDDPNVEIELDGEQLSISGAGIEELKLRPGQYQFRATKDGKPVKQELVTITRGGKQVVRITQESPATTSHVSGAGLRAQSDAFVVLGSKGAEIAKFDTLAEAVLGSSPGDTIEIRGNGPFVTEPIEFKHPLIVSAGDGFRPVIDGKSDKPVESHSALLTVQSPLVLQGLELNYETPRPAGEYRTDLLATTAPLSVTNCRFSLDSRNDHGANCLHSSNTVRLLNSELTTGSGFNAAMWWHGGANPVRIENCIQVGFSIVDFHNPEATLELVDNTMLDVRRGPIGIQVQPVRSEKSNHKPNRVVAVRNSFHSGQFAFLFYQPDELRQQNLSRDEWETLLPKLVDWNTSHNLFAAGRGLLALGVNNEQFWQTTRGQDLEDWNRFWNLAETRSIEGTIRYQGGDLLTRAASEREKLSPEDFRLRRDSAGYQAGPDGKDLGANIDFVGPGEAYERWKQTPEYQQWQKETRELIAASVTQQQQPFVVLSGQGNEVARFVTLTDAVLGSSPGDTIEIRGNGPFVTGRLEITHPLTIRAGEGLRPVFQSDSNASFDRPDSYWIRHSAPLVLEGLHLTFSSKAEVHMLLSESRLMMANCHLLLDTPKGHTVWSNGDGQFQNNMIVHGSGADVFTWTDFNTVDQKNFSIKNDIHLGRTNRNDFFRTPDSLYIQNSTMVGWKYSPLAFWVNTDLQDLTERRKEILSDLVVSSSVIDCSECSLFDLWFNNVDSSDHERIPELALKLLSLKDRGNVWAQGSPLLNLVFRHHIRNPRYAPDMPSWQKFWKAEEKGSSSQGEISFEGGKVYAKWQTDPASLEPDDFCLTAKSAGYHAGPDGKDLGADIDLVGPGEAYERWKQTDEYQQWQKETRELIAASVTQQQQ